MSEINQYSLRSELGKISSVSYGLNRDNPFLMGLDLTFSGKGWGCSTNLSINIGESCKWTKEEAAIAAIEHMRKVGKILEEAKVSAIAELKDVPVECFFDGNLLKDFRILTEVL